LKTLEEAGGASDNPSKSILPPLFPFPLTFYTGSDDFKPLLVKPRKFKSTIVDTQINLLLDPNACKSQQQPQNDKHVDQEQAWQLFEAAFVGEVI
jgi:hypothetical protein